MVKRSHVLPFSIAEAEYIAVGSFYAHITWLKHQLLDYGLNFVKVTFFYDNTRAINLTKNPIQHSHTKHIEIRHHFIRDHINKGDCEVQFVEIEKQLAY